MLQLDYTSSAHPASLTAPPEQHHHAAIDKLRPGFPSHLEGERVWTGSEMAAKEQEWTTVLSEQDLGDIVKALRHFQSLQLGPEAITPETFPLPQDLHDRLRAICRDVYAGRGFGVLRGLEPDRFPQEENVLIYAGVASHVAPVRGFLDVKRELVTCHVISEELRQGAEEQALRPAFTNGRLSFHTDLGDVLALHALDVSTSGGSTMITSSSQLYNEMARMRPDLLHELGENWVSFAAQDYFIDGTPLINFTGSGNLVFQYSRLPITGFRNNGCNPTLPPPTEKRLEAMELLEHLAWANAMPLPTQKGDVAFVNNLALMHARTAFDVDAEGKPLASKRHLVKMMLHDPEMAWELPECLGWYKERVYGANEEGGTRKEKWQLSIAAGEKLPAGAIWAGTGTSSNG